MKTAGIIAEYNPFHKGHAYHIEETRKKTGADYIITAISGDFVQRGAPAITDKYTRAEMALRGGADIVVVLPATGSVSSAESYARTGVRLLSALGIVDYISFGCEIQNTAEQKVLLQLAELLSTRESDLLEKSAVRIRQGQTFPQARCEALAELAKGRINPDTVRHLLSLPNNILALEYLREIHAGHHSMHPVLIPRIGDDYHTKSASSDFASAESIRAALFPDGQPADPDQIPSSLLPSFSVNLLREQLRRRLLIKSTDFSEMLHYALLQEGSVLTKHYAQEPELARRILNHLETYTDLTSFAHQIKPKNRTYTAVTRFLIQILLGITSQTLDEFRQENYVPWVRVIGFRRTAAPLLDEIRTHCSVPVITAVREGEKQLSDSRLCLLHTDLRASAIYNAVRTAHTTNPYQNDYRHPLVYL